MGLNKHLSALPASLRIAHGKQSIKKGIIYRSPAGRIFPSWFSTEIAMLYLHGNWQASEYHLCSEGEVDQQKKLGHVHALEQVTRYAICQSQNEENAEGQRGAYLVDYFRVNPFELFVFARY